MAYLAGGSTFNGEDRERYLGERTRGIVADVADLQRHSLGIAPDDKPVPAVTGIDSNITERGNDQIDRYYRPKAAGYVQRVKRLRTAGDLLAVISVVSAAVAASFKIEGLAAWVPVVTTVGTSVVAYMAAARYDHMIVEFLPTAQRMEQLRGSRADTQPTTRRSLMPAKPRSRLRTKAGWHAGSATKTAEYVSGRRKPGLPDAVPWFS